MTIGADLVLGRLPNVTGDLVFGQIDNVPDETLALAIAFGPPGFSSDLAVVFDAIIAFTFGIPGFTAEIEYDINVDRPLVNKSQTNYQFADPVPTVSETSFQWAMPTAARLASGYQFGDVLRADSDTRFQDALKVRVGWQAAYEEAIRLGMPGLRSGFQDGLSRRLGQEDRWQEAIDHRTSFDTRFQDRLRHARPLLNTRWESALPVSAGVNDGFALGVPLQFDRTTRYQWAIPPDGGVRVVIVIPPFDPCYIPNPDLLFDKPPAVDGNLIFYCERRPTVEGPPALVIVPIKRVYMLLNATSLRRVAGNIPLPPYSMSMTIDADSWTWGFSASLRYSDLQYVMPGSSPVEVEAVINGDPYRFIVESIARDRSFGRDSIRIGGRSKAALLAKPYAPTRSFVNTEELFAQQIANQVLTENFIPLGWAVNWQLEDWLVPTGAFNVRGSYMDGLLAIAGAAGAYLQPHATDQEIIVLPRYPTAPWLWNTVTPDFQLPSSATVQEAIQWVEKPPYNRVFVSGTSQGIIGQVTITGSAGDVVAPMVVDSLITGIPAARQRGIAVLGDTGKQATVTILHPVHETTGIIMPGKFVRYVDGAEERLGLVRGVSVESSFPEVWQRITLETHIT